VSEMPNILLNEGYHFVSKLLQLEVLLGEENCRFYIKSLILVKSNVKE